ncbi:adenosylcobinamide-phosphate synthase CbiB [Aquamicrobium ahrensii]|uniref:Cobalamin biosynthesis protein CobD n=1 Tax=Aquamicrobium ahrensii TaxID=469551 RepID=A0ABV2KGT2_9HYPH
MSVLIAFISLIVERITGYPDWLFRAIGHPVTWIGRLISCLDHMLNHASRSDATRRLCGVLALVVIISVPAAIAFIIEVAAGRIVFGFILTAIIASSLLSQRSLDEHVEAVAEALETGGLDAGRKAVSMIVGRDPEQLDEAGVSRAAIESLAENFSDGIVAPALWLGVGGLAGGVAYKAVNTADSMIGHRTPRHDAFGWASARFDDLVNLPASRLSGLLIVAAAFPMKDADPHAGWRAIWRDAKKHRSPNAGWPEAAMAGALGLALAGPRVYGGVMGDDAFIGEGGRREIRAADIRRALKLYRIADTLLIGLFGLVAAVIWLI